MRLDFIKYAQASLDLLRSAQALSVSKAILKQIQKRLPIGSRFYLGNNVPRETLRVTFTGIYG